MSLDLAHRELARSSSMVPLARRPGEERLWLDCDLASLAENRLDLSLDPRQMTATRRRDLVARVTVEPTVSIESRREFERCYWLRDGGDRVGTIALSTSALPGARPRISSLYVFPEMRRRGVGRAASRRIQAVFGNHGLPFKLETEWCWLGAVRFYAALGLWIAMWKRDLTFVWNRNTPRPQVEFAGRVATSSVTRGNSRLRLARVRRRGNSLRLEPPARALEDRSSLGEAFWHATGTLALHLALRGWPLVRSRGHWNRSRHADFGPPEALAYKITLWEAWAKKHEWIVGTPRIPGLEYPSWHEFEARVLREVKRPGGRRAAGSVPARTIAEDGPALMWQLPFQPSLLPMLAKLSPELLAGDGWIFGGP